MCNQYLMCVAGCRVGWVVWLLFNRGTPSSKTKTNDYLAHIASHTDSECMQYQSTPLRDSHNKRGR
jgi:hypothetical protein